MLALTLVSSLLSPPGCDFEHFLVFFYLWYRWHTLYYWGQERSDYVAILIASLVADNKSCSVQMLGRDVK